MVDADAARESVYYVPGLLPVRESAVYTEASGRSMGLWAGPDLKGGVPWRPSLMWPCCRACNSR